MEENEQLKTENEEIKEVVSSEVSEEHEPSYAGAINELRKEFETKLSDAKREFDKQLKERESIINQLLTETKTNDEHEPDTTIIDRINERRMRSKF